jgi:hypothetical protein
MSLTAEAHRGEERRCLLGLLSLLHGPLTLTVQGFRGQHEPLLRLGLHVATPVNSLENTFSTSQTASVFGRTRAFPLY